MKNYEITNFKELLIEFIYVFRPIFIFILAIFFIYFFVTIIRDRITDYENKFIKSEKFHAKNDYCDYIVVKYRIWERKKIKFLRKKYRNGSQIEFNGGDYVVTNLYWKIKETRKRFFIFGKVVNCWFMRRIHAYVKLVY
ncbi:TPA: hypothetical protein ACNHTV_001569 [Enterococcus faecalis]|uniref:hypothetical protein n=2 Tax=Enterococcus TaxID=1350 RepID=UPI000DE90B04|nr:hypothetical protein [Enterococcus faecalis]DAW19485.1 MAG TPA: hypothetical protein [Caudoviricetes sp.]EGO2664871.1 hypothetical protein [Enterococcus faecalis]MCD5180595.1 hypothetical protein [Enterococcus faecalis]RBR57640.1 hypothetical protein EB32_01123 [Enterococcus faecalis]RXV97286.1 hypothetical protein CYQ16_10345 [Enterococcus faecalis]